MVTDARAAATGLCVSVIRAGLQPGYNSAMPDPAYHPLVRAVAEAMRERCGTGQAKRNGKAPLALIVGVSGGADSVALLRALYHLSTRRGLPCTVVSIDPGHQVVAARGNLEAVARDLRYAALASICHQQNAAHLAVAHHADDQAETVLMSLLRGAGLRGLSGMPWCRRLQADPEVSLIRPMLGATREQVHDYLKSLDQPWREDASNRDTTRTRARLREEVLPALRAMQPDATQHIADAAEHARTAQEALQSIVQQSLKAGWAVSGQTAAAARDDVRQLQPVLRCMVLRSALENAGLDTQRITSGKLEELSRACGDEQGGERLFEWGDGVTVRVTRDQVCVSSDASC